MQPAALLSIALPVLVGALGIVAAAWWRHRSHRLDRDRLRGEAVRTHPNPPSLRRQWALILLPVLGLAIGGVVALSRDQAAVEADARQRANGLARALASRLSQTLPAEISGIELAGNLWKGDGVIGPSYVRWPTRTEPDPNTSETRFGSLAWVHARYPLPPETFLPLQTWSDPVDDHQDPPSYSPVPVPPSWTQQLTERDASEWERFSSGDASAVDLARLTRAVTDPSWAELVRFQRHLATLRRTSSETGNPVPVRSLLSLATNAVLGRVVTGSGTPLSVVLFAEARRLEPTATLDPEWFEWIQGLVLSQPSLFSPWVLEQAQAMVAGPDAPAGRQALSTLRAHWNSDQRRRALALQLTQHSSLSPLSQTNLWLTHEGAAWLAIVQPSVVTRHTASVSTPTETHASASVRWLSKDLLERIVVRAVEAGPVANGREQITPPLLPAGVTLAFELEGRSLTSIPAPWAAPRLDGVLELASADGEFLQEALSPQGRIDNFPSRPRFSVRVLLSDPSALFAAQRRQQWMFGAMILATAGVAGIGLWQADRAFRRQLALNEQMSNFVSSVSHELRAPLASLRLLAEGLSNGRVTGEERRREYAHFLVQETRRLGGLVENVLDFARIEQGRKRFEFESTDVVQLVTETLRVLEPLAQERKVRLNAILPQPRDAEGQWTATWDGRAVQQALINLIDNALKHAPEDTTVHVDLIPVGEPPDRIRIQVRDAGAGIPTEDQDRVFERFYRRGSELRRETQGIGLGLAIVRHIAEAHHGRAWVESEPGHGATFILELPRGGETATPDPFPSPGSSTPHSNAS